VQGGILHDAAFAGILLLVRTRIEEFHRFERVEQRRVGPRVEAAGMDQDDLALFVYATNPEARLRRDAAHRRIEHRQKRIPVAAVGAVDRGEVLEIVTDGKIDTTVAHRPVEGQKNSRQQVRRPELDFDLVRETHVRARGVNAHRTAFRFVGVRYRLKSGS